MKNLGVFVVLLFFVLTTNVFGQQMLLSENVVKIDTLGKKWKTKSNEFYFDMGVSFGNGTNLNLSSPFKSFVLTSGFDRVHRPFRYVGFKYGLTYLGFRNIGWKYKNDFDKQGLNSFLAVDDVTDIQLQTFYFGADAAIRIFMGGKGQKGGAYLDLGGYGQWIAVASMHYQAEKSGMGKIEIVDKHIPTLNRLQYGLQGKLGYRKFYVASTYQLSDFLSLDNESGLGKYSARIGFGF